MIQNSKIGEERFVLPCCCSYFELHISASIEIAITKGGEEEEEEDTLLFWPQFSLIQRYSLVKPKFGIREGFSGGKKGSFCPKKRD